MSHPVVASLRDHYRTLLEEHGDSATATQMSAEGKLYRYRKLFEIGDLNDRSVLDLGCGLGEMYRPLVDRWPRARYHGVDLVPEMVAAARRLHPNLSFDTLDLLAGQAPGRFDYVLMSALFNNATAEPTEYLEAVVARAWTIADRGIGFNFLPVQVNFQEPTMAYHDPARVLDFLLRKISPRVRLEHHYERCDVAVFALR